DGEVDLTSGRIIDMAVRVPGSSLIRVFNELDGVISPNDYLNIPMRGDIREPDFDETFVAREVARMVAQGLIEQQGGKLRDLLRDVLGGGKREPKPTDPADPDKDDSDGDGATEPKPEGDAADPTDALIDSALDLILGGGRKPQNQPKKEADDTASK
ncbi:MAG: hypothetical protein ACPGYV_06065, partial [Phycisphaeraceae bacterium]